jgi:long-chain fatty acid transport protein
MSLSCLDARGAASFARRFVGRRAARDSRALVCLASAALLFAAVGVLWGSSAMAAGFWLYEMGTPDLGTASAGRAALAKDAATVFGNPAGMTSLKGSQLLIGTQLVVGDVHFDSGPDTTVSGGNGGNASGTTPGGSLYYAQSVTPDLKLGFWSGSYFAGALQYEDGWSGRYYGTKVELVTLGAGINGAYRINDWLSIGGGPFLLHGRLEQKAAVNNVLDGGEDGRLKFADSELGGGGMAGLMLEPVGGTRFGVTYISPVKLNFKDRLSTKNLGPVLRALGVGTRKIKLGLTVPQQVMLSGYHDLTDDLALMGNLVWQNWSDFGKPDIAVAGTNINETANLNYDDTWGFALGAQYAFADGWLWSVGGGFDTSPMSKSQRSPNVPLDQQYRLGTGLQYSFNEKVTVGAAYQYMNGGDADLDVERGPLAGRLQGDYKSYDFHFFALNLSWRL